MIPIKHPDLENLANRHWEAIKNYIKPKKLKEINESIKKIFDGYDFEKIVLAKPNVLKHLASINCRIFGESYFFPKSYYDYLSKDKFHLLEGSEKKFYRADTLVDSLDLSVCPYCNRNFIRSIQSSRICELDHFYPKKKYPLLAMSFYNLIPSCKTCNQTFKKEELIDVNPYEMENNFNFKLKILNTNFYHSEEGFDIDFSKVKEVLQDNFRKLGIEELYKTHKDIVLELIQKKVTYSDEYIDDLFQRYQGTLFKNREDVLKHLSGNYITEEDFKKRPLSKLTHDIAEDLGFI
jgi:hypothetical protein